MSADNYYLIRRDPVSTGKFVVSMGFASDDSDEPLEMRSRDPRFDSLVEAIGYAQFEYPEYGYSIEPDCLEQPHAEVVVGADKFSKNALRELVDQWKWHADNTESYANRIAYENCIKDLQVLLD